MSRPAARLRSFALWFVGAALLFAACKRTPSIAELERIDGTVDRDHRASVGKFEKAAVGATFLVGDGIRTGQASRATLQLFDKSRLDLDPKTLLRFLDHRTGQKGMRLDIQTGQATLEASDQALELELAVGTARLDAHGRVRLTRSGDTTRLQVVIGSARILRGSEALELSVGDAVDISSNGVEPVAKPAASAIASASAAPVASAAPSASAAVVEEPKTAGEIAAERPRGPSLVDFMLGAGDSVVVHDPKPPTAIAWTQSSCADGAILTLDRGGRGHETVGAATVSADVPRGSHRYSIACLQKDGKLGKRVASGSIVVLHDAGLRRLAKSAPLTSVDTDGRRYTVLYQSLLPKLSVRWPNPPEASSYTLKVTSGSSTRTFSSSKPNYSFPSGTFHEGDHAFSFEGGGKRSRPTSVAIRFDNAAPTASITSPADGSFGAGGSALVSGSALPGWTVSVGGHELDQDAQNRFSETVTAPSGERALVIRFSQPGHGVHYYLRRSVR